MNSKLLKSGHIKLYKRENSKYWQMKVKKPKLKAIRSSTGSKILKDAEKIALKYYSSISSKTNIKLKRSKNIFKESFFYNVISGIFLMTSLLSFAKDHFSLCLFFLMCSGFFHFYSLIVFIRRKN